MLASDSGQRFWRAGFPRTRWFRNFLGTLFSVRIEGITETLWLSFWRNSAETRGFCSEIVYNPSVPRRVVLFRKLAGRVFILVFRLKAFRMEGR